MNADNQLATVEEAIAYLKADGCVFAHPDYVLWVRRQLWLKKQREAVAVATPAPVPCK